MTAPESCSRETTVASPGAIQSCRTADPAVVGISSVQIRDLNKRAAAIVAQSTDPDDEGTTLTREEPACGRTGPARR